MNRPDSILVIRRKALGDVLVSMPVVDQLVERWPQASIDFVVDEGSEAVVDSRPELRRVLVYEGRAMRRARPREQAVRSWRWLAGLRRGHYDVVIDLMGTPQTAVWTWWTGAPIRVGRARRGRAWAYTHRLPPRGDRRFAGEVFLDAVRILGGTTRAWSPSPAFADLRWQGPHTGIVTFNPSATWPAKAWPWQHFADLGQRLSSQGLAVRVLWGPGEERARDEIVAASAGTVRAAPATDLRALTEELCASELLVTTDSGPKHLAVAHGVPTLSLFGSTDPVGWQPPGALHRWLSNPMECHPCNLLECPVDGHPCLDELSPERVHREVSKMLVELRSGRGSEGAR